LKPDRTENKSRFPLVRAGSELGSWHVMARPGWRGSGIHTRPGPVRINNFVLFTNYNFLSVVSLDRMKNYVVCLYAFFSYLSAKMFTWIKFLILKLILKANKFQVSTKLIIFFWIHSFNLKYLNLSMNQPLFRNFYDKWRMANEWKTQNTDMAWFIIHICHDVSGLASTCPRTRIENCFKQLFFDPDPARTLGPGSVRTSVNCQNKINMII
jgi:hypothetical protein